MPLKGGAKKARASMRKTYGKKKGDQVFWATANKYGKKGKSRDAKARTVFKKGGRRRKRR
jgi:hypothetical protein